MSKQTTIKPGSPKLRMRLPAAAPPIAITDSHNAPAVLNAAYRKGVLSPNAAAAGAGASLSPRKSKGLAPRVSDVVMFQRRPRPPTDAKARAMDILGRAFNSFQRFRMHHQFRSRTKRFAPRPGSALERWKDIAMAIPVALAAAAPGILHGAVGAPLSPNYLSLRARRWGVINGEIKGFQPTPADNEAAIAGAVANPPAPQGTQVRGNPIRQAQTQAQQQQQQHQPVQVAPGIQQRRASHQHAVLASGGAAAMPAEPLQPQQAAVQQAYPTLAPMKAEPSAPPPHLHVGRGMDLVTGLDYSAASGTAAGAAGGSAYPQWGGNSSSTTSARIDRGELAVMGRSEADHQQQQQHMQMMMAMGMRDLDPAAASGVNTGRSRSSNGDRDGSGTDRSFRIQPTQPAGMAFSGMQMDAHGNNAMLMYPQLYGGTPFNAAAGAGDANAAVIAAYNAAAAAAMATTGGGGGGDPDAEYEAYMRQHANGGNFDESQAHDGSRTSQNTAELFGCDDLELEKTCVANMHGSARERALKGELIPSMTHQLREADAMRFDGSTILPTGAAGIQVSADPSYAAAGTAYNGGVAGWAQPPSAPVPPVQQQYSKQVRSGQPLAM